MQPPAVLGHGGAIGCGQHQAAMPNRFEPVGVAEGENYIRRKGAEQYRYHRVPRFAAKREKKPRVLRSLRRFSPCSAHPKRATSSAEKTAQGARTAAFAAGLVVVPVIFPTSSKTQYFLKKYIRAPCEIRRTQYSSRQSNKMTCLEPFLSYNIYSIHPRRRDTDMGS